MSIVVFIKGFRDDIVHLKKTIKNNFPCAYVSEIAQSQNLHQIYIGTTCEDLCSLLDTAANAIKSGGHYYEENGN